MHKIFVIHNPTTPNLPAEEHVDVKRLVDSVKVSDTRSIQAISHVPEGHCSHRYTHILIRYLEKILDKSSASFTSKEYLRLFLLLCIGVVP